MCWTAISGGNSDPNDSAEPEPWAKGTTDGILIRR